jgi:hypothetical protein
VPEGRPRDGWRRPGVGISGVETLCAQGHSVRAAARDHWAAWTDSCRRYPRPTYEHVVLLSSPNSYGPIGHQRIIGLVRQQIEQGIVRSGVAHTVLYPSWLATNALRDWGAEIRTNGTVSTAYPDARMTPIHIDDVAWVVGGAPGTTAVVQQLSSRTVGLTGAATPGIDFRRPNLLVLIQNLVPVVSSNPIDMPQNSMRRGAGDNSSCARA